MKFILILTTLIGVLFFIYKMGRIPTSPFVGGYRYPISSCPRYDLIIIEIKSKLGEELFTQIIEDIRNDDLKEFRVKKVKGLLGDELYRDLLTQIAFLYVNRDKVIGFSK